MNVLDFLKTVFGSDISIAGFDYPEKTPYYMRDGYTPNCITWNKDQCVLLTPKALSWRLPVLKKQISNFQEICPLPCALCLENLTALQRRNLVENGIPFVSPEQQIYLPFWGCLFTERFKAKISAPAQMTPGTQLIFLYLYYRQDVEPVNLTQLSKQLSLSKATCTRAVNDLTVSGLISLESKGTNKWISPTFTKPEFLNKAFSRLKSPVERLIYVKRIEKDKTMLKSGVRALADLSMIGAGEEDGAVAIVKKKAAEISAEDIITRQDFYDFGGYAIEVWSYDPVLLTENERVDDISLLLSLQDDKNERIQMGLDEIRRAHELPIKYEE